ncbi:MAG: hypothetical protein ACYS76_06590 [Planctomycetota bacterium]|jgi:hypothetical protein
MARARNRKKKALYEVIGQGRLKPGYGRTGEPVQAGRSEQGEGGSEGPEGAMAEVASKWPRRPRVVQFSAGRIEISMPYQLGIAVVLGVILLFLVVYRLGQMSYSRVEQAAESGVKTKDFALEKPVATARTDRTPEAEAAERPEPVEVKGNNRIVIQTFQVPSQLEPVREYFGSLGIETEIRKMGDWYYLVTKDKYDNPERPGTDGYAAKEKIIELGADYKAPPGYESFGTRPFHDAYGMKFDD